MAVSGNLISYIAIGIFIVIIGTAIYIGRQLYKERVRKELENSGKQLERELELELGPLPNEMIHESLKTLKITPKSSLENSSTTSSSQGKRRKSLSNVERNSKSLNRIVKTSPKLSRNGSVNDSNKYGSTNGSRYSRSVSKASSLVIKIPNEIPPPPPPSPLKSQQDDSIKTLTNIIPSDISGSTYTGTPPTPLMSSKASSSTDLKTHSLMPFQSTTHGNHPELA